MSTLSESPKAAGPVADLPAGSDTEVTVKRLTPLQFWGCLGVALVIFAFSSRPVWSHPWDMGVLNVAILVSYLPLPVMVVACLAWSRALNLRGFFLDTLVLTLLKYSITFMFALALWAVAPDPTAIPLAHAPRPFKSAEQAPVASLINPTDTGILQGILADASGRPVPGALVFIESGLEKLVFAAPTEPLLLENNGAGVTPRIAVARLRQPVQARSTDGHLHTFIATKIAGKNDGATLLNAPLLSSGAWSPVSVRDAGFIAAVHCSVHQRSGSEAPAYLAVLDHPFFAITGSDGAFRFNAVPAGSLRVAAFHPELGQAGADARLEPGASQELALRLRKP